MAESAQSNTYEMYAISTGQGMRLGTCILNIQAIYKDQPVRVWFGRVLLANRGDDIYETSAAGKHSVNTRYRGVVSLTRPVKKGGKGLNCSEIVLLRLASEGC